MKQKNLFNETCDGNVEDRYERRNHIVGVSMWQFEWCPKYRVPVMSNPETRAIIAACIRQAAFAWNIRIIEINVQPEHLHLTVQIPLTMTPSSALQKLKGISARKIFEKIPAFGRFYKKGHLWSRGKFASSLGFIQIEDANRYVRNQDEHHALIKG